MNLIQKWFGKQAPAAAVVVDRIALIEAERDAALAAVATAKAKLADLAILTAVEHAAAENAAAEGRRTAERAEAQIAQLRAEQAVAEAREEREAFDRDVAAHERETDELAARIEREYPELAAKLGGLLKAIQANGDRGAHLWRLGRKLGQGYAPRSPEAFRAGPQTWSVSWPNPDKQIGGLVTGNVEDAPRGALRWENGEPVPAREGVTVRARRRNFPDLLLSAIRSLPGLRWGDPAYLYLPPEPKPFNGGRF